MLDYPLCTLNVKSCAIVNAMDLTLAKKITFILDLKAFLCANRIKIEEVRWVRVLDDLLKLVGAEF